jgi:transposase
VTPSDLTPDLLERLLARITDLEALVASQAAQIAVQANEIGRLQAHIAVQEAQLAALQRRSGSDKNARNSSIPPSQSPPPSRNPSAFPPQKKGPRQGHPGNSRRRAEPTLMIACHPQRCTRCGADLCRVLGHVRNRSQQIELPPLSPRILEVLCYRCFCPECGTANTAPYPEGWDPNQTFGPRLQATLAYLHHSHHLGYERVCGLFWDLFGLPISEGAVANALARTQTALAPHYEALAQRVRESAVVGSDETRQRVDGRSYWGWVVQSAEAVYHWIAHSRSSQELIDFFGESLPDVQESDGFSAQLASPVACKQVCQAHQLRDLLYAHEHGDEVYAPRMSRLIRMAIHLAHRREPLSQSLYAHQAARLKRLGHQLGFGPLAKNPFGEAMQQRYRRWEAHWWVFLDRADVNPTNNASERALRPAVVHRKVLGGFRSEWGAAAYACFLSIVQTLQKEGRELFPSLLTLLTPPHPTRLAAGSDV